MGVFCCQDKKRAAVKGGKGHTVWSRHLMFIQLPPRNGEGPAGYSRFHAATRIFLKIVGVVVNVDGGMTPLGNWVTAGRPDWTSSSSSPFFCMILFFYDHYRKHNVLTSSCSSQRQPQFVKTQVLGMRGAINAMMSFVQHQCRFPIWSHSGRDRHLVIAWPGSARPMPIALGECSHCCCSNNSTVAVERQHRGMGWMS